MKMQMKYYMISIFLFIYFAAHGASSYSFHKTKKSKAKAGEFKMHWNVPTYKCKSFEIDFTGVLKKEGIIFNNQDKFRGENILILYDPGDFPIYTKDKNTNEMKSHNGGIPQKGNLNKHLEKLREVIANLVPKDFVGLGVLDFEVWRPVFRQNWNDQTKYKNESIAYARQQNPNEEEKVIKKKAKESFEEAATKFMRETLEEFKKARPNARVGYYGFPYCLNYVNQSCPEIVKQENDRTTWLFNRSTAYFPSVYISQNLPLEKVTERVKGRMEEAKRVSTKQGGCRTQNVHPYVWFRYYDNENKYLSEEAMKETLRLAKQYGMGGVIMWGSSSDVNTKEKCENLRKYVEETIGPLLKEIKK